MIAALERSGWRVGGKSGAAELLSVSPSTFKSRMKALAISRPGERRSRPGETITGEAHITPGD